MANPFENGDSQYLVLKNFEGQFSLWPSKLAVPIGWEIHHGPEDRPKCLHYIEDNWSDMRPLSLIKSFDNE